MTDLLVNLPGIGGMVESRSGAENVRRGVAGEPAVAFATALSTALGPQRARGAKESAGATADREPDRTDERGAASATETTGTRYGGRVATGRVAAPGQGRREDEAAAVDAAVTAMAGNAAGAAASPTRSVEGLSAAGASVEEERAADLAPATGSTSTTRADAAESTSMDPVPRRVNRALGNLLPEFRVRLERVIDRMESEFGHEVAVVETVRDQARQEQLFAQGRTTPGPVVTWTRASNHTVGRAADLMIDGTYDNPLAMVRLARIAREEGLRTLGARDPGHVELPDGITVDRLVVGADASSSLLADPAGASRVASIGGRDGIARIATVAAPAGIARVADTAAVAQVAMPAQLARTATVARIARPGHGGESQWRATPVDGAVPLQLAMNEGAESVGADGDVSPPLTRMAVSGPTAAAMAGRSAGPEGSPLHEGGRREGRSSSREPMTEASGDASSRVTTASPPGSEVRGPQIVRGSAQGPTGVFGAEAVERIARVLQLQDAAPTRPLSQVVLRVDNAVGGEDRIRVDLRGSTVGASLELGDPLAAARMHSELGQLQRALEGKGLRAEHLSVLGGLTGREVDALRSVLPADQGQRALPDQASRRDGGGNDASRNRSDTGFGERRRNSQGDSQQGRQT